MARSLDLVFWFLIFSFFDGANNTQTCVDDKTQLYSTAISESPSILSNLYFNEGIIEIEFDIIPHQHCNSHTPCDIIYLTNTYQSISLSLNNDTSLILSLIHNHTTQYIQSTTLLSVNGHLHHMYLLLNLDGISQSVAIIDDLYWYLPPFNAISIINASFALYFTGPSQVAIDATLSNLCLDSSPSSTNSDPMDISCGDTIDNVIFPHSYQFLLNDSYSVTMDCISTDDMMLNVYDIDDDDVSLFDSTCYLDNNSSLLMNKGTYLIDISTDLNMSISDPDRYILSLNCTAWEEEAAHGPPWYTNSLFLLVILSLIMLISCYYCNNQYMHAFVVDNAMVLIIGIARFDDPKWYLRGVFLNAQELANLWKMKYGYDVFICKNQTKRNSQLDIQEFIEDQKEILKDGKYQCVIVHILSHGSSDGDAFMTSDGCMMKVADIRRELASAVPDPDKLVKLIFNHECRESGFNDLDRKIDGQDMDYPGFTTEDDTNWATIWANVKGYSVTELAHFTTWITGSFGQNLTRDKEKKTGFVDMMTEIGINLEHETGGKYSSDMDHTLHYSQLIFERCSAPTPRRDSELDVGDEVELQTTSKQFIIKISEM